MVGFEWDEESKAGLNFQKHGVLIPEAIPVFEDSYAITVIDDDSDPNEQRFVTIGLGTAGRLLVVVYTERGDNIRIISARPASFQRVPQNSARPAERHEGEQYEEQL